MPPVRPLARVGLLLCAMALATGAEWLRVQPSDRFSSGRSLALDSRSLRPERGLAWIAPLPEAARQAPSDDGGVSSLRLLQGGRRLLPHALHDEIRSRGGGLFSHWGDALYFSTLDGSDPRTGSFEIVLAPERPAWLPVTVRLGFGAAAVLLLGWLLSVLRRALSSGGLSPGGARVALASGLAILCAVAWVSRLPAAALHSEARVALDPYSFRPYRGSIHRAPIPEIARGFVSDRFGVSPLRLFRDGQELVPHAQVERGADPLPGSFAHLGPTLFVSLGPGQRPVESRFELVIPPRIPAWRHGIEIAALAAAGLLLLCWLHVRTRRSARRTALVAAATAALVAATWALVPGLLPERRALGRLSATLLAGGDAVVAGETAAHSSGRSQHLVGPSAVPPFTSDAALPSPPPPTRVTLIPERATAGPDGFVQLERFSSLRSVEPLDLDPADLEAVVLRLRVRGGNELRLRLSEIASDPTLEHSTEQRFPVEPSGSIQEIRLVRPAVGGQCRRIRHVSLLPTPRARPSLQVDVAELRLEGRLESFARRSHGTASVELAGSLRPSIWQSVSGSFTLELPKSRSRLLKLAVGALSADNAAGSRYAIRLEDPTGRASTLATGTVDSSQAWREISLQLPEEASGRLLLDGVVPTDSVLLWSGLRRVDTTQPATRVVLVLVDTLRADFLGSGRTPTLDRLAAEGIRFEQAFSQAHWTRPSMPSIMTGHYVGGTGVRELDQRLPEAYLTLAEAFTAAGFVTVSVLQNPNAGPAAGLAQGFGRVTVPTSLPSDQQGTQGLLQNGVLPMLDALEGDDLFLYLHLMEVHAPYGPAEPADPEHWNRISGEPVSRDSAFDRPWALTPTAAQRRALYEHDVRVLDRELGRFLDRLLERFERDGDVPVTIAVMSDHGEFLGEYGQWGHAFFTLYPEVVHVPLILRAPGRIPPGTLWRAPVENRQIGPTLLELAGVPAAGLFPAPSLLQSIGERAAGSQPPFALASGGRREDAETLSLFGERFSYLGFSSDDRRIVSTFADTRALERIPPAWPFNALEEAVQGVWQSYLESQEKVRARGWADVDERTRIIDPRERSMLRALGYVDE